MIARHALNGYAYSVGASQTPGLGYYHPGLGDTQSQDDSSWIAEAGKWVVSGLVDLFGGGGDRPPSPWGPSYTSAPRRCPGQESYEVALATVKAASYSERYQLAQMLKSANGGVGPSVSELAHPGAIPYWTQAAHGGHDCVATSPAGQRLRDYWKALVAKYGGGATEYPSTTTGGGGGTIPGTNIPLPEIDVTWPGRPTQYPAPGTYTGQPVTAGIGAGILVPLGLAAILFFAK